MTKELNLNSPYKVFKNSEYTTYYFQTDFGVKYIVYFTDADEYFDDFYLRNTIYTFGFEPENRKSKSFKIVDDKKIKITLISIIKYFFQDKNNVLTFVADISDLKQKARNRLFEIWKNEFDINNEFEKYDTEIITEDETYYSSMIIHSENNHKKDYKKSFLDTANGLNK